jgi:predicted PurR-regulated permease PerM
MNSISDVHIKHLRHFIQFVGVVMFIALMYFARDVLIPLALGTLLAFLLKPVVNRLERLGLNNITAVISAAVLAFGVLTLFLIGLSLNLASLSDDLPNYRKEIKAKIEKVQSLAQSFGSRINQVTEDLAGKEDGEAALDNDKNESGKDKSAITLTKPVDADRSKSATSDNSANQNRNPNDNKQSIADGSTADNPLYVVEARSDQIDWKTWAGSAAIFFGPLGTAGLAVVVALFALIYRDDLRDRFVSVVSNGQYVLVAEALDEASAKVGKYLFAQVTLNFSYGLIFALGLYVIGQVFSPTGHFPYIVVLGALAGVVRFIPYLGPWIGAVVPIGFSILIFPGFNVTAAVVVLIVAMELISNNVVEPWLYGSSTGVTPMAVILAAIFWGWLWGPIGIVLATPLTVCFVVLGKHVPRFRYLATLLSDEPMVPAAVRMHQRLLSDEQHKIEAFIKEELSKKSVAEFLDQDLIPLVKLIENMGNKSQQTAGDIFEKTGNALQSVNLIAETESTMDAESSASHKPSQNATEVAPLIVEPKKAGPTRLLFLVPANSSGEYLIAKVLEQASLAYSPAMVLELDDFMDGELSQVPNFAPEVVVLCVIPPQGISQARYWTSQLRQRGFQGTLIVGCFGRFRHYDSLFVSLRREGANALATSAGQLLRKLGSHFRQRSKRKNTHRFSA